MADDGRNSGMRGRASRRGATAPEAEAAGAEYEELAAGGDDDGGWKTEIDSITNGAPARARRGACTSPRAAPCAAARARATSAPTSAAWHGWTRSSFSPPVVHLAGTHPALLEELKTHEKTMNAHIAQAQRVHQLQKTNIDALFDCEKKEAADENKVRRKRVPELSLGWHCACTGALRAASAALLPRCADTHCTPSATVAGPAGVLPEPTHRRDRGEAAQDGRADGLPTARQGC